MVQNDKKRVLILLSAYNGEKYLREQLDSLLALGGGFSYTVRIRDDGSGDGTRAILSEYAKRCGFEVLFGENIGYNASFFSLIDGAEEDFDYYALCDQDDVWLPGKFVRAAEFFGREEGGPLLYSGVLCLASEDLSESRVLPYPKRGVDFYNAMIQNVCSGHTMVFNAPLLRLIKGTFSEGILSYDHWILLAATAFGKVLYDDVPQVLYRQHGKNAVGASGGGKGAAKKLGYLRAGRGRAMALQLQAFCARFGDCLRGEYLREAERFLGASGFCRRVKYAFRGKAYRQSGAETLAFRCLFALGAYRARPSRSSGKGKV